MNGITSTNMPLEGGVDGLVASTEVRASAADPQMGSVLKVSDTMVGLTWLAFIIACFALYKLAWKPISEALDLREEKIRQSLEEVENIQKRSVRAQKTQQAMIEKASQEAAAIIDRARVSAESTARALEEKARTEAETLIEDATVEIGQAKEKALTELRRETSGLALKLAGRVLEQKLDSTADRELTDRLIREIQ